MIKHLIITPQGTAKEILDFPKFKCESPLEEESAEVYNEYYESEWSAYKLRKKAAEASLKEYRIKNKDKSMVTENINKKVSCKVNEEALTAIIL